MSTYLEPGWLQRFAELWEELGPETKTALLELLGEDWSFEGKRVLDFGCGAGRTLRHFRPETEVGEFWGVDIDATSIDLLTDTVSPPFHFQRAEYMPPLELESASFDLIWSISVFTHLTDSSIPWLLELHRLLKPGGVLIATYMGRWTSELLAGEPWDEDRVGMNVLRHNHPASDGAPLVMISDWWLREHWGRAFEVRRIEPNVHNQSWAVLVKREGEFTPAEIEAPSDDPRELIALRHNLLQAQREVEAVKRSGVEALEAERRRGVEATTAALQEQREVYEDSISWRLTRPLRVANHAWRQRRGRTTAER